MTDDSSQPPSKRPDLEAEEEERKRGLSAGGGGMNPATSQLAANIRPDVVDAPGGPQIVTTQKSTGYRADQTEAPEDIRARRAKELADFLDSERQERKDATPQIDVAGVQPQETQHVRAASAFDHPTGPKPIPEIDPASGVPVIILDQLSTDMQTAVDLPLPISPSRELLEAAHKAAENTAENEMSWMNEALEWPFLYSPPPGHDRGEPEGHEAESLRALDRAEGFAQRLRDFGRDPAELRDEQLATLNALDPGMSVRDALRGEFDAAAEGEARPINEALHALLPWRPMEPYPETMEEALAVIQQRQQQNDQSAREQSAEAQAAGPSSEVLTGRAKELADFLDSERRERNEREDTLGQKGIDGETAKIMPGQDRGGGISM